MASQAPGSVDYFDAGAARYEETSGDCTKDLARSVLDNPLLDGMYSADSLVLDNAAGPAIVTEEILLHARRHSKTVPRVCVVDPAPTMIRLADEKLARLAATDTCTTHVMLGEDLRFPDDTFSHSITNLGLLFFRDGTKGIQEIYRTLKPGGIAVITCWSYMGYIDGVVAPSQMAARPQDPPYTVPLPEQWFRPDYIEKVLKEDGGFSDVLIEEREAHFGAPTRQALGDLLEGLFTYLWKGWNEEEQQRFKSSMRDNVAQFAEDYTMMDGKPGFGIPMKGIIATGEKRR